MKKSKGFPFGLLLQLLKRDFKARYRRSMLGLFWLFIQPVAYLTMFIIVRMFAELPSEPGKPYILFALSAILPWSFFSAALLKSTGSLVSNITIIQKINTKNKVFPLSSVVASAIESIILFIAYIAIALYKGYAPGEEIVMLPLMMLLLCLTAFFLSLITAALNVFIRDIQFAMGSGMPFLMLMCPVMYPVSAVPEKYHTLYMLNPLAGIIEGFRDILVRGKFPDAQLFTMPLVGLVILIVVTVPVFNYLEKYFADHA
jgi:lipopolysaccharide transport system permease protein